MKNFWKTLEKPILTLAPMEDVTDTVFRRLVAACGRPDVFFTEFTSADGLFSPGRKAVIHRLHFTEEERPLVAQIWGLNPENYYKAAKLLVEMGFDGIDINMGCPVPKIIKNGACSALIDNPLLAKELILAAKEGAGDIPLSIKTRLGFKTKRTEEWSAFLLEQDPAALIMHGRTAKQQSKVPADWEQIGKVVEVRDQMKSKAIVIGNGDVQNLEQAHELSIRHKVDGVMIGRGIFHNLFLFNPDPKVTPLAERSIDEKIEMLTHHAEAYVNRWGDSRHFGAMKKFFKIYISNFNGAVELRTRLMPVENLQEMKFIIDDWMKARKDLRTSVA